MTPAQSISARIRQSGFEPDTMLGILYFAETGYSTYQFAKIFRCRPSSVSKAIDAARLGQCGRVAPANAVAIRHEAEFDGLLPHRWKRAGVALMLRPDGATMAELADAFLADGYHTDTSHGVQTLRAELKELSVKIDAVQIHGSGRSSYRITGRSAWRMQTIIGNGWAL